MSCCLVHAENAFNLLTITEYTSLFRMIVCDLLIIDVIFREATRLSSHAALVPKQTVNATAKHSDEPTAFIEKVKCLFFSRRNVNSAHSVHALNIRASLSVTFNAAAVVFSATRRHANAEVFHLDNSQS